MKAFPDKCLAAGDFNGHTADAQLMDCDPDNTDDNQKWILDDEDGTIRMKVKNRCLDTGGNLDTGGENGELMHILPSDENNPNHFFEWNGSDLAGWISLHTTWETRVGTPFTRKQDLPWMSIDTPAMKKQREYREKFQLDAQDTWAYSADLFGVKAVPGNQGRTVKVTAYMIDSRYTSQNDYENDSKMATQWYKLELHAQAHP